MKAYSTGSDIRWRLDAASMAADQDLARNLGTALGEWAKEQGLPRTVVVGSDSRPSSHQLRAALIEGLEAIGFTVIDIGLATTPLVALAQRRQGAAFGIQVTASHLPVDFQGVKITGPDLGPLSDAVLQSLLEAAEAYAATQHTTDLMAGLPYISDIAQAVRVGPKPLKVVLDAGGGPAGPLGVALLERLGVDAVPLFCDGSGTCPHDPDPAKDSNVSALAAAVVQHGADFGFATDGDGDRGRPVGPRGDLFGPDQVLAFFARDCLRTHPGAAVVAEVKTSMLVQEEVVGLGGTFHMAPVGHANLKRVAAQTEAVLWGEASWHMGFAGWFDDALYTLAQTIGILSSADQSLSHMLADIPTHPITPVTSVRVESADEVEPIMAAVCREVKGGAWDSVLDIDGVRFGWADAWALIRPSRTELGTLTLRAEGRNEALLNRMKGEVERLLAAFPAVTPIAW